jgi:hypothetical protein
MAPAFAADAEARGRHTRRHMYAQRHHHHRPPLWIPRGHAGPYTGYIGRFSRCRPYYDGLPNYGERGERGGLRGGRNARAVHALRIPAEMR